MPTPNIYANGVASFTPPIQFAYVPLLTDGHHVVTRPCTLASGTMARGTIVKWDPAALGITAPAAASDCNAVLVNDIDATAGAAGGMVVISGKVNAAALTFPAALNHGSVTDALRNYSVIIETCYGTDGTLLKSAETTDDQDKATKEAAEKQAAKDGPDPYGSKLGDKHPAWAKDAVVMTPLGPPASQQAQQSGHQGPIPGPTGHQGTPGPAGQHGPAQTSHEPPQERGGGKGSSRGD